MVLLFIINDIRCCDEKDSYFTKNKEVKALIRCMSRAGAFCSTSEWIDLDVNESKPFSRVLRNFYPIQYMG